MKKQFMSRAIELSIESVQKGGGPFGSVIVKDNKIISEGFNTVTSTNDPTSHAEISVIRKACKNLNNFIKRARFNSGPFFICCVSFLYLQF